MTRFLPLAALVAGLAVPAAAQDASAALAQLQALADTGSFDPEDLPAVAITAEGCVLTIAVRAVSPQLDVPLGAVSSADARDLLPAGFTPDPTGGRMTIWIPREDQAPIDLTMTIDSDDSTAREAFSAGLGASCDATGPCTGIQAVPRMPVNFYLADGEDGMVRARAFSTALSEFAAACTPAE